MLHEPSLLWFQHIVAAGGGGLDIELRIPTAHQQVRAPAPFVGVATDVNVDVEAKPEECLVEAQLPERSEMYGLLLAKRVRICSRACSGKRANHWSSVARTASHNAPLRSSSTLYVGVV